MLDFVCLESESLMMNNRKFSLVPLTSFSLEPSEYLKLIQDIFISRWNQTHLRKINCPLDLILMLRLRLVLNVVTIV